MSINQQPIGIFDSGLGGLTVFKEIRRLLKYENLIYFGDTARVPYGNKSKETIVKYSKEITKFLLKHNVKLIVAACNTVSSLALDELKKEFSVPIFGVIEPGARRAYKKSIKSIEKIDNYNKNNKYNSDDIGVNNTIAVIGTKATIGSKAYSNAINRLNDHAKGSNITIIEKACPLLVPLVEEGWIDSNITSEILKYYLQPIIETKPSSIVLGCTHYPMLKTIISKIIDKNTKIIDSGKEVSIEVRNFLINNNMLNTILDKPFEKYYVSDDPEKFKLLGNNFLGKNITEDVEVIIDFL
jgi:glutamate racemase